MAERFEDQVYGEAARKPRAQARGKWWAETKGDVKWAVALLFVLTLGLAAYIGWSRWQAPPASEENLKSITTLIFAQDGLVVPFEILSVALLAALIAGVVIAFRDPEEGGPAGFVPPESSEERER